MFAGPGCPGPFLSSHSYHSSSPPVPRNSARTSLSSHSSRAPHRHSVRRTTVVGSVNNSSPTVSTSALRTP